MKNTIRKVVAADIEPLKEVLKTMELFPPDMLEEMTHDYFNNPTSQEIWVTTLVDGKPMAFGYCGPEKLTEGTFNLYAIGVHASMQGKGFGSDIMDYIESLLIQKGERILIAETSSNDNYAKTYTFYKKKGFEEEARIRDFWNEGDDKIIFWKKLSLLK